MLWLIRVRGGSGWSRGARLDLGSTSTCSMPSWLSRLTGYLRLFQIGLLFSDTVKAVRRFVSEGERTDCTLFPFFRTVIARPHPKDLPGRRPAWTQRHVWSDLGVRISAPGLLPSPSQFGIPEPAAIIAGRFSRASVPHVRQGL
jgi:hypothetical protein